MNKILVSGYIKKNFPYKKGDSKYIAICVNLSLTGYGNTAAEAYQDIILTAKDYLTYAYKNHREQFESYSYRPVLAKDIIHEFKMALELSKRHCLDYHAEDIIDTYVFTIPIMIGQ